jgi:hypothetical protein
MLTGFADENGFVREVSIVDPLPVTNGWTGGRKVSQTIAFDGGAGSGAVGTVALFTVTGNVTLRMVAYCTEDLVSGGGGTCEVGCTGNTNGIIAQTTATAIDDGEVWFSNTPVSGLTATTNIGQYLIVDGADIILTVGTGDVTDGTIVFDCYWTPMDSTSSVVAA